jgi:hypothetical protein
MSRLAERWSSASGLAARSVLGVSYTSVSARRPSVRVVGYLVFARAPNQAHQDVVLAALAGYLKNILASDIVDTDFLGFPRLRTGLVGSLVSPWRAISCTRTRPPARRCQTCCQSQLRACRKRGREPGGGIHAVVVVFVELAKEIVAARHLVQFAEARQVGLGIGGAVF